MNRSEHDEILSAYLDDELSAVERCDVERRLQSDPQARQTLEQLRAVSGAVQSLPPFRLGADLSQDVLRQVEQERLAMAAHDAVLASPRAEQPRKIDARREGGRRFLRPRALFWAAAAVVIGLFVSRYEASLRPLPSQTAQTPPAVVKPLVTPDIGPRPGPNALVNNSDKSGGVRAQAYESKPAVAASQEALLVKCYLTPEAKRRSFPALLTREDVFLEDLPPQLSHVPRRDPFTLPAEWTVEGLPTVRFAEVEAPHLQKVLADLHQHVELYLVVVIEPAPGVETQSVWRAYQRVAAQAGAVPTITTLPAGKQRVVFALQAVLPAAAPQK
jgi:anti-sigma factor RsiW